ncbi:MAG: hypothetical protein HYV97_06165 [Bdellovibrio sp.]|nr:hypothetical protein [Bdellovibrio sp.]
MSNDKSKNSFLGIFFRLYWMIIWAFPSMIIISFVVDKKIGVTAYFLWPIIFLSMIGTKYIDIKFYEGTTADGKPATMHDFKNYCLFASPLIPGASLVTYLLLANG